MTITTRAVRDGDRQTCIEIEHAAIPGLHYLDDVWEQFTRGGDGELTAALMDGELAGFGKLTRLYGPFGWLETLRVRPERQGQGAGKAIYRRYLEELDELSLRAVGMYTGADNEVSRGLAERFGLSLRGTFAELLRAPLASGDAGGFVPVAPARAEWCGWGTSSRMLPASSPVAPARAEGTAARFYPEMGAFLVVNRTFYPVGPGLGAELGRQGWLYENGAGALAVAGWRFQPERAVHLAFCSGDAEGALALASALARRVRAAQLSAVRETGQERATAALLRAGFGDSGTRLITMWRGL